MSAEGKRTGTDLCGPDWQTTQFTSWFNWGNSSLSLAYPQLVSLIVYLYWRTSVTWEWAVFCWPPTITVTISNLHRVASQKTEELQSCEFVAIEFDRRRILLTLPIWPCLQTMLRQSCQPVDRHWKRLQEGHWKRHCISFDGSLAS